MWQWYMGVRHGEVSVFRCRSLSSMIADIVRCKSRYPDAEVCAQMPRYMELRLIQSLADRWRGHCGRTACVRLHFDDTNSHLKY